MDAATITSTISTIVTHANLERSEIGVSVTVSTSRSRLCLTRAFMRADMRLAFSFCADNFVFYTLASA